MEFTEPQWHGLKKHAEEKGLQFLSSPFSVEAVELLTRIGAPYVNKESCDRFLRYRRQIAARFLYGCR